MLLLRWFINTLALLIVASIVPGFHFNTLFAAFITALLLGLVNATLRWVLIVLTLPINILSLGLFTFVINGLMILLVSKVVRDFEVAGFWPAFWGAVVLWLISLMTSWFLETPQSKQPRVHVIR